jgi:hypothetical protein
VTLKKCALAHRRFWGKVGLEVAGFEGNFGKSGRLGAFLRVLLIQPGWVEMQKRKSSRKMNNKTGGGNMGIENPIPTC